MSACSEDVYIYKPLLTVAIMSLPIYIQLVQVNYTWLNNTMCILDTCTPTFTTPHTVHVVKWKVAIAEMPYMYKNTLQFSDVA